MTSAHGGKALRLPVFAATRPLGESTDFLSSAMKGARQDSCWLLDTRPLTPDPAAIKATIGTLVVSGIREGSILSDTGISSTEGAQAQQRPSTTSTPRLKLVPALEHAIAVVNFLNEHTAEAVSLAEISGTLNITKSHCRSILMTLVQFGWVRFDERTKTYQLHSGLLASASSLMASPVLSRIRERLDNLVKQTGYSCVLTQPQTDDSFVVIENFTTTRQMEVSHPVGFPFPRDAPAQMRAYIAWQGDDRLRKWMANWKPNAYTPRSITTPDALIGEVEMTRERGYSRSVGEHFEGMMAFGLPIYDRGGDVSYVFCVMGFVNDLRRHERSVAQLMKKTCRDIHQSIMAKPPAHFLDDAG